MLYMIYMAPPYVYVWYFFIENAGRCRRSALREPARALLAVCTLCMFYVCMFLLFLWGCGDAEEGGEAAPSPARGANER